MNPDPRLVLLPREDQTAWLVFCEGPSQLCARFAAPPDEFGNVVTLGDAGEGWDAAIDTTGTAWIAYVDGPGSNVFVRRAPNAQWGTALQVSSSRGSAPIIRADEFGNVWVSWIAQSPEGRWEIRVCRMGPRSGQEMVAASFDEVPQWLDAGARGGVLWHTISTSRGETWVVTGTEHSGFRPPVLLR